MPTSSDSEGLFSQGRAGHLVPKGTPTAKTPSKVAGVADALESLERRRRSAAAGRKPQPRRGDLDLDAIP